jgi:hypothetical protein
MLARHVFDVALELSMRGIVRRFCPNPKAILINVRKGDMSTIGIFERRSRLIKRGAGRVQQAPFEQKEPSSPVLYVP